MKWPPQLSAVIVCCLALRHSNWQASLWVNSRYSPLDSITCQSPPACPSRCCNTSAPIQWHPLLSFRLDERETGSVCESSVGVDDGRLCLPGNLLTIWQESSCKQTAATSVIWPIALYCKLEEGSQLACTGDPARLGVHTLTHTQPYMHTCNTQAWSYLSRILSTLCKLYVCCGGTGSALMSGSLWQHQSYTLGIA